MKISFYWMILNIKFTISWSVCRPYWSRFFLMKSWIIHFSNKMLLSSCTGTWFGILGRFQQSFVVSKIVLWVIKHKELFQCIMRGHHPLKIICWLKTLNIGLVVFGRSNGFQLSCSIHCFRPFKKWYGILTLLAHIFCCRYKLQFTGHWRWK